ncbi:hypothetical protein ACJMK2_013482 [Sinanodonta woodiana]|uniref:N-acetyltransferase domain-containing protein n=1 Tax=Sinanodonta woodiana TaxID=1069815 RepID=A0ABD3UXL9_SINWO
MRWATAEDKNKVLVLSEKYHGDLDYLPSYYDSFLQNPVSVPFVISKDSEIIGYMSGFVIDNGETIAQRAGIMSPKFQNRGYLKLLNEQIIAEARKRYNIQRMVSAVDSDNPYIQSKAFWEMYTSVISTKDMFRYMVIPNQLISSELPKSHPLKNMPIHVVAEYFDTEVVRKYLFPEDRIVINWIPYRLLPSNLALLECENTVCVSDVQVCNRMVSGLLSIATFYTIRRPRYAYTLDLYGSDVSSVRHHLLYHLKFIANELKDLACLSIVVGKQLDKQKLFDVIAECGLNKLTDSGDPNKTLHYYMECNL